MLRMVRQNPVNRARRVEAMQEEDRPLARSLYDYHLESQQCREASLPG
jgi:hypothetical protein